MTTQVFPRASEKPVCVFCGSSPGRSALYADAARSVGQELAAGNVPLVYGGGRRGLMGVVSQAALEAGGLVHGIVPRALITRASENTAAPTVDVPSAVGREAKSAEGTGEELVGDDYEGRLTLSVTESMHERKTRMAQISTGGFIVLPGGYGTFEEAFEMITWNQLKIHQLPVVILNIDNFYTPLRTLVESASSAGFINPENLSLVKIVDLPGGETANSDPSRAAEWGKAALDAVKGFTFSAGAGYNLNWSASTAGTLKASGPASGTDGASSITLTPAPSTASAEASSQSTSTAPVTEAFSLFTTMRYTSSSPPASQVTEDDVALIRRHLGRLRGAWDYFGRRDERQVWGSWLGDEAVWQTIKAELEKGNKAGGGDWRVRVILHRYGKGIEVQLIPASPTAGFFDLTLPPIATKPRRRLVLDPADTVLSPSPAQDSTDPSLPFRLYKTTQREIYDTPSSRFPAGTEVLLHTSTHLLETCTSNIALYLPERPGEPEWVTPKLTPGQTAFLAGTARAELLDRGVIREGEVTMEDWRRCMSEGRRVVGFNGFVGVWEARFD